MLNASIHSLIAAALLAAAGGLAACSQGAGSVLPDVPSLPTQTGALSADQQKKAIDDLLARRSQHEAEAQQQAKTQR